MFQDGVKKIIFPASRAHSDSPHSIRGQGKSIRTPPKRLPPVLPSPTRQSHAIRQQATAPTLQVVQEIWLTYGTGFLRSPCNNFRYSLTLFSKFFASFPNGTCALLVSHRYLALEGIYFPLWASIPKYSTLWGCAPRRAGSRQERESHPLSCPWFNQV